VLARARAGHQPPGANKGRGCQAAVKRPTIVKKEFQRGGRGWPRHRADEHEVSHRSAIIAEDAGAQADADIEKAMRRNGTYQLEEEMPVSRSSTFVENAAAVPMPEEKDSRRTP